MCRSEQRDLIAEEDRYRQLFAEDRGASELEDPHVLLHDVFNLPADKWDYQALTAEEVRARRMNKNVWQMQLRQKSDSLTQETHLLLYLYFSSTEKDSRGVDAAPDHTERPQHSGFVQRVSEKLQGLHEGHV